jgi:hypothetical protein
VCVSQDQFMWFHKGVSGAIAVNSVSQAHGYYSASPAHRLQSKRCVAIMFCNHHNSAESCQVYETKGLWVEIIMFKLLRQIA